MTLKLPRTIRLDASDEAVFERAAEPGEWAVAGGFAFLDTDPTGLAGKRRQAFVSGFLGTETCGWSTFVVVATADAAAEAAMVERLAALFVAAHGAPDLEAARPVARQEVELMAGLCRDHAPGTLLAITRSVDAEDGIRESFRAVDRRAGVHGRVWDVVPDEDQP